MVVKELKSTQEVFNSHSIPHDSMGSGHETVLLRLIDTSFSGISCSETKGLLAY